MSPSPIPRRAVIASLASVGALFAFGGPGRAQSPGSPLTNLLGSASDHALDHLAMPGAFYNDHAIRIAIPGLGHVSDGSGGGGSLLGDVLGAVGNVGGLDRITRQLNDAAGMAAHAAKPVFRAAIARMRLTDLPDIATHRDGGTQYLRTSSGDVLHQQVRPLIDSAMRRIGAYSALDRLSGHNPLVGSLGLTGNAIGNSVTDQALNGIYRYMADEEARLRADPLGTLRGVIGAIPF